MKKLIFGTVIGMFCTLNYISAQSQVLYSGFPEKFDTELIKESYEDGEVKLNTGMWRLKGVKLLTRRKGMEIDDDGTKGLLFVSNNKGAMVAEMKFDLEEGISKVSVQSFSFGTDAPCKWRLQMSTDRGSTWKWVGKEVVVDNKIPREEEVKINANGPIRVRVLKLGLGNPKEDSSIQNGRLVIDNIAIYKK
ncbi:hypothetical protein [Pseudopedobacter beijingensis]|uniref:F5/8 type C domain-containing protein n=1 Tax=Pseudopedobacter beijingensis TaxID=1207056 RepID=A0ABW4ICX6_9SPHI